MACCILNCSWNQTLSWTSCLTHLPLENWCSTPVFDMTSVMWSAKERSFIDELALGTADKRWQSATTKRSVLQKFSRITAPHAGFILAAASPLPVAKSSQRSVLWLAIFCFPGTLQFHQAKRKHETQQQQRNNQSFEKKNRENDHIRPTAAELEGECPNSSRKKKS